MIMRIFSIKIRLKKYSSAQEAKNKMMTDSIK